MTPVRIAGLARLDLGRLSDFMSELSPGAERRAMQSIRVGLIGLTEYPMRGVELQPGLRKLIIPFGQSGYVVRYRFDGREVVVTRIHHMFEDQGAAR